MMIKIKQRLLRGVHGKGEVRCANVMNYEGKRVKQDGRQFNRENSPLQYKRGMVMGRGSEGENKDIKHALKIYEKLLHCLNCTQNINIQLKPRTNSSIINKNTIHKPFY